MVPLITTLVAARRTYNLLLARKYTKRPARTHDGKVIVMRSYLRWCSVKRGQDQIAAHRYLKLLNREARNND